MAAIPSSPALGRPYLDEGDRAAAPRGWLRDRPNRALPGGPVTYDRIRGKLFRDPAQRPPHTRAGI